MNISLKMSVSSEPGRLADKVFTQAKMLLVVIATIALVPAPPLQAQDGWVDLFNGTNLDGWVQRGGKATYAIEGGEIIGTSVLNTPNTFLCTAKTYGDFILEYDFKVDQRLNSGVQIRSECFDAAETVEWNGKAIHIPAGRVHGYQIEIDPDVPRKRMWSAGIYDEGRRGWLFPTNGNQAQAAAFSEQGMRIFKPNDWNHVRIEAVGDSIKTWLNGTPCAAITDSMTPRGFIALQVHGIGNNKGHEGTQVRWRNLKLTEAVSDAATPTAINALADAEKVAGWKLLWDGKTSAGWRSVKSDSFPARGWTMKNGVLTIHENGGKESEGGGDIITRKRYASFELTVDFKITPGANSGIKIFVQPNISPIDKVTGKPTAVGSAIGMEFQVLDDVRHPDAKLGRNGNRTIGSLYDLIPAPANKLVMPVGEWNHARILSQGKHVEFWLNGRKTVECERGSEEFRKLVAASKYHNIPNFGEWADGHILLQDHGNEVSYCNVKIRELPAN